MNKIKYLVVALFTVLLTASCERDYTPPPLSEPKYEGALDNISIKQLKERYADIVDPKLIEDDLIVKAVVTGNDESGNIYKQLYIQDATAGINIGIDQNSIYGVYQVGQEIYLHLKDLYVVKYGGELQIGLGSSSANRIGWEVFQEHAFLNSWPKAENAVPEVVDLGALTDDMVNTLVELKDVTFVNGGKNSFATKETTVNEAVKDAAGNSLDVRTSGYSTFYTDILPTGKGTLVGILGRYNGGWQLFLRTKADVKNFDGQEAEPEQPAAGSFFKETFGAGSYPSGNRPKIADFTDFDMKAPVKYSDATGAADVRSTSTLSANVWLPSGKESGLKIEGINTLNKGDVTLTFQLLANVSTNDNGVPTANLNNMKLKVNGTEITIPSKELSAAAGDGTKYYTVSIPNIAQVENLTIEFIGSADANKAGFRIDNIELLGGASDGGSSGPIIVTN